MENKLKNGLALALIPQIIVVKWLGKYPEVIEKYYSQGLYPLLSGFWHTLLGWVPFSVGDLLYAALILGVLYYLITNRSVLLKRPLPALRDLALIASVAYFSFHLLWGFNYYRVPLAQTLNIPTAHSQQDLVDFVARLVDKTNEAHRKIKGNPDDMVVIPYTTPQIFDLTVQGYQTLEQQYPLFRYTRPSLKKSVFSIPLTYMGYGGYLNPFTNEAQVNANLPTLRIPVISGHEIGHQIGYSAENETNFIGCLVTINNEDPYFQYSGYTYALSYCLNELARRDKALFDREYARLNPGIRKNYKEIADFWDRYENPLEPVFKSIFNIFLKANNQSQGIKSYHGVVSLLVTYYKEKPL